MRVLKLLGFVGTVLGLGGRAGAIEFGTGYLPTTVLGIGGILLLIITKERNNEEDSTDIIDMLVAYAGNNCKCGRMHRGAGRGNHHVGRTGLRIWHMPGNTTGDCMEGEQVQGDS